MDLNEFNKVWRPCVPALTLQQVCECAHQAGNNKLHAEPAALRTLSCTYNDEHTTNHIKRVSKTTNVDFISLQGNETRLN